MIKKLLFTLVLITLALIGCPDPSPTKGGVSDTSGEASSKAGDGSPCSTGILCDSGLTCVNGICLPPIAAVDAGTSTPDLRDSGLLIQSSQDSGHLPSYLDGGTGTSLDAGQTLVIDSGPPLEPVRPWLLSVKNDTHELIKIDIETGLWTPLCTLSVSDTYHSTTFGFDGTLYGSNSNDQTLDIIDPCTCEVTSIGPTNQGNIPGITANGDKIETLFGLSTSSDTLVTLDIETGAGTLVGSLGNGLNFINSGTTWATSINGLYSINSGDRKLYNLHTETGIATPITTLDIVVGAVGIEWHPVTQELYLCSDPLSTSYLYEVNVSTGETTQLGTLPYRCTNLAAPWTPVSCVDPVVVE